MLALTMLTGHRITTLSQHASHKDRIGNDRRPRLLIYQVSFYEPAELQRLDPAILFYLRDVREL